MKRGFYTIMAAQFFSSLADNALLIAAIAQLLELDGPAWMIPLLKFFFTVSYVALAAFVGAFADAIPKGRVMFITNTIKIAGCALLFFTGYVEFVGIPEYAMVLTAYAVVGFGAAASFRAWRPAPCRARRRQGRGWRSARVPQVNKTPAGGGSGAAPPSGAARAPPRAR